jgi:hypothetical protein
MHARLLTLVLTMIALSTTVRAMQDFIVAQAQTEERVAGLLRLPEVYGEYPCQAFEPRKIAIYETASAQRPPIGTIELVNPPATAPQPDCEAPIVVVRRSSGRGTTTTLPYDESGYEFRTAVVYERSGEWFRIALLPGSAWIHRENSDPSLPYGFLPYPEALVSDGFNTYLRPGWDGSIWSEPGRGPGVPAPDGWRTHRGDEIPVRILNTRVVDGNAWIQIRFESENCGTSLGTLPDLRAWLPAYRSTGITAVWFYSRGC